MKESQDTTTYSVSQLSEETVIEDDFEFMQQQGMVSMQESEAKNMRRPLRSAVGSMNECLRWE